MTRFLEVSFRAETLLQSGSLLDQIQRTSVRQREQDDVRSLERKCKAEEEMGLALSFLFPDPIRVILVMVLHLECGIWFQ